MSESKRFKHDYASLEQLPNELFIEIFRYLNGVDTVYAFSQLNNRFQSLLNNYVNIFDLKSISKAKFDFVTRHHDIHRWRSLRLSDDDRTPGQIKLFCQLFPPAEYISQLQSLSVVNIKPGYIQELLPHLRSFDHLVSLIIGKICGEDIQPIDLPSLKRLVVTSCKHTDWIMNVHSLESMEYTVEYNCHHNNVIRLPTTLKELKMLYKVEYHASGVQSSLHQLSKLTKLSLYDKGSYSSVPNGREWEEFIRPSLPLLTTFQLCFPFHHYYSTSETLNELVASFSTPFYLIEKRWFIRCHSSNSLHAVGILYSLPFVFTEMTINTHSYDKSMSTLVDSDINETKSNSYAKVKTLIVNEKCPEPFRDFTTSNIDRLVLNDNLSTNWFSLLISLRSLELGRNVRITSTEFAHLLSITPQLQSLSISTKKLEIVTDQFTNHSVCDQLSQRIQSLTIASSSYNEFDRDIIIIRLLHSLVRIFGKRCEHLSFAVLAHPKCVLPILRDMRKLRSLHIHCYPYSRKSKDILTSWLRQQSTGPTDLNFVHITDDNDYYAWFGDRL